MATSMFMYKDKLMNYQEFMLTEAIAPKRTAFGTDKECSNGKHLVFDDYFLTCVKRGDSIYLANYDTTSKNFGFSVGKAADWTGLDFPPGLELTNALNKYFHNDDVFTDNPTNIGGAVRIIGEMFYVALQLVTQAGERVISFEGATDKLKSMYDRMVKNKFFMQEVEKLGWTYDQAHSKDGDHVFIKRRKVLGRKKRISK